jgi:GNAT superfamily N-acetyltransferase
LWLGATIGERTSEVVGASIFGDRSVRRVSLCNRLEQPMTHFRPAQLADAEQLLDLLQASGWFSFLTHTPGDRALEQLRRHVTLALADDSHSIYVAQHPDGMLLGYIAVHWLPYLILSGPEGYVSELFVRAEARGHGIGSQLLALVTDEARERGCARLSLLNMQGRQSYQRGFYRQQGWEERADARNFIYRLASD